MSILLSTLFIRPRLSFISITLSLSLTHSPIGRCTKGFTWPPHLCRYRLWCCCVVFAHIAIAKRINALKARLSSGLHHLGLLLSFFLEVVLHTPVSRSHS